MKHRNAPRRHLKPEQRRRMAERCESSGLSHGEFASRHGISLSSLKRWLGEQRSGSKESAAVVFEEVTVSPALTTAAPVLAWAVEIEGRDGTIVRCREGFGIEDIARLVRERAC